MPGTLVWGREGRMLCTAHSGGELDTLPFDHVIAATGATDRHLPVPGWTMPGVYSLGGAQIALKNQLVHIGRRTLFAGNGPLLYLVAAQYLRTGGGVAAVLDTSTKADKLRALPALASKPALAWRGIRYAALLRAHGVPVHEGARVRTIERTGEEGGFSVTFAQGTGQRSVDCDAVALGYGLQPESQLAELFDVDFQFDSGLRQWLPAVAADGSTRDPLFSMAGDGCSVLGADAAALMGERVAWALASRFGVAAPADRLAAIDRRLEVERRFAQGLRTAFALPSASRLELPDDTILCRCEVVTAGELRAASTQWDTADINRLKAITRCGMGRCQGRMCGGAAAEIIAAHRQVDLASVGRLRAQQPLKPIALRAAASTSHRGSP